LLTTETKLSRVKEVVEPTIFKSISPDQVFYNFDCTSGKYNFINPAVTKLLGYSASELNEIKFENIVITKYDEYTSKYPMNGKKDGLQIEERLTVYFVETKMVTTSGLRITQ